MRIAVIASGYVGLVTGECLASIGIRPTLQSSRIKIWLGPTMQY